MMKFLICCLDGISRAPRERRWMSRSAVRSATNPRPFNRPQGRRLATCVIFTLALAMPGIAAMAAGHDSGEPRSPGDMSTEERIEMMKNASRYDNCVYSHAIAKVGEYPDIRQTADIAMTQCQGKLTELENSIVGMGFGSDFATSFSKRIRNRAARKILPELAIRKSGG